MSVDSANLVCSQCWAVKYLPSILATLVFLSGIYQIVYLIGLGAAYKQADIGVIYQWRALPVLMVGLGTVLIEFMNCRRKISGLVCIDYVGLFVCAA